MLDLTDSIIMLPNETHLVLEIKGQDTEQDRIKRSFLEDWVKAVNYDGRFLSLSRDMLPLLTTTLHRAYVCVLEQYSHLYYIVLIIT